MDFTSSYVLTEDYAAHLHDGLKGRKLAVIKEIFDSVDDQFNKQKFLALVEKIKQAGAQVSYVEFGEELLRSIYATYIVISCAEATSNDANLDGIKFGPYYGGNSYQEVMMNARTKGFSELIKRRFVIGSFALMKENQEDLFLRAQRNRAKIVEKTNEILAACDAILVPAAPSIAAEFAQSSDKENGMPLGINLMSKAFTEATLLSLAQAVEGITGLGGLSVANPKEGNL